MQPFLFILYSFRLFPWVVEALSRGWWRALPSDLLILSVTSIMASDSW